MLVLREEPEAGEEAHRRTRRVHLRRVHRPVQRDHRGGALRDLRAEARRAPEAARDLRVPRRVRGRPGHGEEGPVRRRLQPLQADPGGREGLRRRAAEVQHHDARPHGLRQDAAGADAGAHAERPVRHRRRHRADGGRLRRRGRREHPAEADPGRRLRREEGRDRHHLHRRGRQDRPQVREPLHHPRRERRGRAAGAAEDPRGHHGQRAAAGRPQAPPPGVHPDRHHEHPVHLRRGVRRAWTRSSEPHRQEGRRVRRRHPPQRREGHRRDASARCCPRTC